MRVTLIHNPDAGYASHSRDHMVRLLREVGYEVEYWSASKGVTEALQAPEAMVIVAGGDGTVRQVAKALLGRTIPIAILPQGTANNIARVLGWEGELEGIVTEWEKACPLAFDAGVAEGPWGREWFFEAAGMGLFAEAMPKLSDHKKNPLFSFESPGEELRHDVEGIRKTLARLTAQPSHITLDGEEIVGEFLMIEAMNICALGPGLRLAPDADPGDGLLDIVLIKEEERVALDHYLKELEDPDGNGVPPQLPIRRGRTLEMRWEGAAVHFDDRIWPESAGKKGQHTESYTVRYSLKRQALQFLCPMRTRDLQRT